MDHKKFIDLLARAKIIETRTGVKGSIAYPPLGMKLRNKIVEYWKDFVTEMGYEEVLFPILIPEKNFNEFDKVFSVKEKMFKTSYRDNNFFLKPTGECELYPAVREWLKDSPELPLKIFQIGSQLRPHKDTSIMLNGDEQLTLMEGHSFHKTKESALIEFEELIKKSQNFTRRYGMPFIVEHRCEWKNKPFYEKECSIGTWLFSKDRSFCNTVIYHQGNNFSKILGIKFNGNFIYQNTFGVNAERLLASLLSIYSEENQIVIPPHIFPQEFVTEKNPIKISKQFGYPLVIGKKFAFRIDSKEKIPIQKAISEKKEILDEIKHNLEKKAKKRFESIIVDSTSKEKVIENVSTKKLARFFWCKCKVAKDFEKQIPGEFVGYENSLLEGKCLFCGKQTKTVLFAAKRTSSP